MSDPVYIGCIAAVPILIAGFFLAGFHHEIAYRRRQRRYKGWIA